MDFDSYKLKIVLILTAGFGAASLLGYLSHRLKLSPILGYLLAGYVIGPYSPGFVADLQISEQLAEIGVILMMLGVGMHFKWEDLSSVKGIAIPGALVQTFVATFIGALLILSVGWTLQAGIVVGMAIGVASTVVLLRMLTDNHLMNTREGHTAVGWLIVEDVMTVIALVLLPTIAPEAGEKALTWQMLLYSIFMVALKFLLLMGLMLTVGRKVIFFALFQTARTHSHELLTLTVLALTFIVATGSAFLFGTSIALGAFIAGMVIGQTAIRHQASANALVMRDVFGVIFFLSVGMLFNPEAIFHHFYLFVGMLSIILVVKPLAAILIILLLRYPLQTALVVGVGLAQIGEFSFILSEEAMKLKILPEAAYDVIVACALISIFLNPLLFKAVFYLRPYLQRFFKSQQLLPSLRTERSRMNGIVVGYGPVGKEVTKLLENRGYSVTVIDRNIDTISKLQEDGKEAIYGDATQLDIIKDIPLEEALILVITVPDTQTSTHIIRAVRQINPKICVLTRARHMEELHLLQGLGVYYIWCDEEQVITAFDKALQNLTF